MCFYIDKKNPNKQIAKKDIVCWKVLEVLPNNKLMSIYYPVVYKKGKLKTSRIDKITLNIFDNETINKGLHSFTNKNMAIIEYRWIKSIYNSKEFEVVKCIIPAGSAYFVNRYKEEYVSNKIMML